MISGEYKRVECDKEAEGGMVGRREPEGGEGKWIGGG